MRVIAALVIILCFGIEDAQADRWGNVAKVDCIPEINYFKIKVESISLTDLEDSDFSTKSVEKLWKKYGMLLSDTPEPIKYKCTFKNGGEVA